MNGTVYPSLVFSKVMAKQGKGCIVNVSSMAAYSAITRVPGYSAAKTAVANFTQWLASELALKYGDGIRVNAIAPGFFIGDQNRAVLINPDGSLTDRSKKVLAKTRSITPSIFDYLFYRKETQREGSLPRLAESLLLFTVL